MNHDDNQQRLLNPNNFYFFHLFYPNFLHVPLRYLVKNLGHNVSCNDMPMNTTVMFFYRIGSRHIREEIRIPCCKYRINKILCKIRIPPIQSIIHTRIIYNRLNFEAF